MKAIENLTALLDNARQQIELANYIDSTSRMQQERAYWSARAAELQTRLDRRLADREELI